MQFLSGSFIDANLPYLTLMMGLIASLLLYVGLGHRIQRLGRALVLQKRRVESLEKQLAAPAGGVERRAASCA